jgi:uncharacterized protein (TIGR01777 family)
MNVLISGGTGLIGSHLTPMLQKRGYAVGLLSRSPLQRDDVVSFVWDPGRGSIDGEAIRWADAIIHLAGAGIADQRWTDKRKKEIISSRERSGDLLFKALKEAQKPLEVFVGASAVGYYGGKSRVGNFKEDEEPATDFQGITCQRWEAASRQVQELNIRTVILRVGVVLTSAGGALPKMALPIRFGVGSPLGSGKQAVPWIHIDDVCEIFIKALEDQHMEGTFNAVAPEPINNGVLTRGIAQTLHRPLIFPRVPGFALKLLLGDMSEIVLEGNHISSAKILDAGYSFKYATLDKALQHIFAKPDEPG